MVPRFPLKQSIADNVASKSVGRGGAVSGDADKGCDSMATGDEQRAMRLELTTFSLEGRAPATADWLQMPLFAVLYRDLPFSQGVMK